MEYLSTVEDKAFDLAIVDPPYGIGEHGGKNRTGIQSRLKGIYPKNYKNKGWDNVTPDNLYFDELRRIAKHWIVFGANYFEYLIWRTAFKPPKKHEYSFFIKENPFGWIIWDKKTNDGSDFNDCELAHTSFDEPTQVFKYDWIGFGYLNNPQGEKKIHPTQKPVALYKWLLKNYAKPGDRILDTHLGSGSIAIACHQMGFDLVGCEIDTDYYNAALKRFNLAIKQQTLFDYNAA